MNLKSAISAITGQLSHIKEELTDTNRQIDSIDGKIHELRAMPVSLEDYGIFLRKKIEKQAEEHTARLEFDLFSDSPSLGFTPYNKRPMSAVEDSTLLPAGLFGGSDADFSIRSACFFFADQIHDEFMRRAQAKFGKRWGNEDLPSVDERRKMIADMEVQRKDLMRKRADLEVQIDEIPGALKS